MVSIKKKIVKQVLFILILTVIIYLFYLNIPDFLSMVRSIDYEELISEFLRLLRGEFYWHELLILNISYVFVFYKLLVNLIIVIYSVRISSITKLKLHKIVVS
ncbi:hypothetical protein LCGC14_1519510 [marine sediment metagenome]|uniref:Uncharacterized protein n=1 Tax=marine sediment metagenome TaxID=412755 RepID=A0A0F9IZ95_9ZZZZ